MPRCTCGCDEDVSRKTILRHLSGRATKAVIVQQQHTFFRRHLFHRTKTAIIGIPPRRRSRRSLLTFRTPTPRLDDLQGGVSTMPLESPVTDDRIEFLDEDMVFTDTNDSCETEATRLDQDQMTEQDSDVGHENETMELARDSAGGDDGRKHEAAELATAAMVWNSAQRYTSDDSDEEPEENLMEAFNSNSEADSEMDSDDWDSDIGLRPSQRGLSASEILEEELEIETSHLQHQMSNADMDAIRAHNFKVNVNLGGKSYTKLCHAFPQLSELLSLHQLQTRVAFLSGIKPIDIDCCKNSCCCFTGPYESLDSCLFCDKPRLDSNNRPKNVFSYLPLIPRLVNLFTDAPTAEKMEYRARRESTINVTSDIFDAEHYRHLQKRKVTIGDEDLSHNFFSQPTDIALGLSTDGFGPFKSRKQTCWPLIGFNYNLPPDIRFHLVNIICFGIIPGPKQPKDIDSFLVPLVDELIRLMRGVSAFDSRYKCLFALRAYLIVVFGDMPAISKLMQMKGHNGLAPCRACNIVAVRDMSNPQAKTHYTPLHRPDGHSYDPLNLPLRSHNEFIRQATQVAMAANDTKEADRAKMFGIKGVPILSTLSSLSFPTSFPHDFMHLVMENVIPNLASLWTSSFKGLDAGNEDYELPQTVWDAIGAACSESGNTIPSAFGCRVPNIASERHYFKAESWLLFATLLGPVLLHNRFSKRQYYDHFVKLIKIINTCLQFSITSCEIDEIERGLAEWVVEYERIYYQFNSSRLCVCTLPIHALLHIPDDIRRMGPVWCYWAFVTERFCGSLLPAVKSHKYPYRSLAHRIRDIAQLNQLKIVYHLAKELELSDVQSMEKTGHKVPSYPDIVLVSPHIQAPVEPQLQKKIAAHLVTNYNLTLPAAKRIIPQQLSFWGKLKEVDGGDMIHAKDLVHSARRSFRDMTFIKYHLDVDRNRNRRNMPVDLERKTFYGQVQKFIELSIPADLSSNELTLDSDIENSANQTLVLASIGTVRLIARNRLGFPYYQGESTGTVEVIDVSCIDCVVGRVKDRGKWAIIERAKVFQDLDFGKDTNIDGN